MELNDVAVFLLKNTGIYLIAKYEQLDEEPSCYLTDCFKIISSNELEKFPLYAKDRDCLLTSSDCLTIFEPDKEMLDLYKKYLT